MFQALKCLQPLPLVFHKQFVNKVSVIDAGVIDDLYCHLETYFHREFNEDKCDEEVTKFIEGKTALEIAET